MQITLLGIYVTRTWSRWYMLSMCYDYLTINRYLPDLIVCKYILKNTQCSLYMGQINKFLISDLIADSRMRPSIIVAFSMDMYSGIRSPYHVGFQYGRVQWYGAYLPLWISVWACTVTWRLPTIVAYSIGMYSGMGSTCHCGLQYECVQWYGAYLSLLLTVWVYTVVWGLPVIVAYSMSVYSGMGPTCHCCLQYECVQWYGTYLSLLLTVWVCTVVWGLPVIVAYSMGVHGICHKPDTVLYNLPKLQNDTCTLLAYILPWYICGLDSLLLDIYKFRQF